MAVVITVAEVKDGFDTALSDPEIEMAIGLLEEADACFDRYDVAEGTQRALKLYAVRHILSLQSNSGRGSVTSERAPSGAGRSFGQWKGSGGSPYWGLIEQLDRTGCIKRVLNLSPNLGAWTIGAGA